MLSCRDICTYNLKKFHQVILESIHHTSLTPTENFFNVCLTYAEWEERLHTNLILQWTRTDSGSLSLQHHITGPCLSHGSLRFSAIFAISFHPIFPQVNSSLSALIEDGEGICNQNQQITPNLIVSKGFKNLSHWVFYRALWWSKT